VAGEEDPGLLEELPGGGHPPGQPGRRHPERGAGLLVGRPERAGGGPPVGVVDAAAREDPGVGGEDGLRVAAQHQDLESARPAGPGVAHQHHGRCRLHLDM